jgi:hypothetical protein
VIAPGQPAEHARIRGTGIPARRHASARPARPQTWTLWSQPRLRRVSLGPRRRSFPLAGGGSTALIGAAGTGRLTASIAAAPVRDRCRRTRRRPRSGARVTPELQVNGDRPATASSAAGSRTVPCSWCAVGVGARLGEHCGRGARVPGWWRKGAAVSSAAGTWAVSSWDCSGSRSLSAGQAERPGRRRNSGSPVPGRPLRVALRGRFRPRLWCFLVCGWCCWCAAWRALRFAGPEFQVGGG